MTETPARRRARSLIAHGLVDLAAHLVEVPPGTPEQVDLLERFTVFARLLGGLYPVEQLRAVHTRAAERTGRPLTDAVPDADVLGHMIAMIHELSALDAEHFTSIGRLVDPAPAPVALDAASATALAKANGIRFVASVLAVSYTLPPGVPPPRVCAALRYAVQALEPCYRPDEWLAVNLDVKRDLEMLAEPGEPVHVPDARLVSVVESLLAHLIAHDAPPPTEPSEAA